MNPTTMKNDLRGWPVLDDLDPGKGYAPETGRRGPSGRLGALTALWHEREELPMKIVPIGGSPTRQAVKLRNILPNSPFPEIPSEHFMGGGTVPKWAKQNWRWDEWSEWAMDEGPFDAVWWMLIYNREENSAVTPEVIQDVRFVRDQIEVFVPGADVFVSPIPLLGAGVCKNVSSIEVQKSINVVDALLQEPTKSNLGIAGAGPVLSMILPEHTYDGCHQGENSPHGQEMMAFEPWPSPNDLSGRG